MADELKPVTHEQARESARRLINSHFGHREPVARVGIPARPDYDDDLLITRYIEEQAAAPRSVSPARPPQVAELVREGAQAAEDWRNGCYADKTGNGMANLLDRLATALAAQGNEELPADSLDAVTVIPHHPGAQAMTPTDPLAVARRVKELAEKETP